MRFLAVKTIIGTLDRASAASKAESRPLMDALTVLVAAAAALHWLLLLQRDDDIDVRYFAECAMLKLRE